MHRLPQPLFYANNTQSRQMKETLALIETQSDYQLALQLDLVERAADDAGDWSRMGGAGRGGAGGVHMCPVS